MNISTLKSIYTVSQKKRPCSWIYHGNNKQESRAVARIPRDAAAVVFGLKFADNIHYKSNSIAKFESQASELQTYRRKTEFNAKWPF